MNERENLNWDQGQDKRYVKELELCQVVSKWQNRVPCFFFFLVQREGKGKDERRPLTNVGIDGVRSALTRV